MEKFKIAMGFPMLATAIWLFSLTVTFYGERTWWLGIFLVFVGLAAWIFGAFVQHGRTRRGLATVIAIVFLVTGYAWALDSKLEWRKQNDNSAAESSPQHAPKGYPWERWSPTAVAKARAEGRPVVVDFTAAWCQTCNIQVKPAFEGKAVIEKLRELNAAALVADYTRYPADITQELERFERAGVPLVLVYPADATKPPLVLPEPLPLTPYGPTLLDALAKISK
jgi:thiol:disulfide interchange protein DsbD